MRNVILASAILASMSFGVYAEADMDLTMPVTEVNSTALQLPPLESDGEMPSQVNKVSLDKEAGKDIVKLFNQGNPQAGKDVRYEYEEVDEYGRPRVGAQSTQQVETAPLSMQDIAKSQYKAIQKFDKVKPGANLMAPGAYGMQNRIQTNFKYATVNTSAEETEAVVFVEEGFIYVTPKSDNPVDLLIFEAGAPESAFNITLVPVTVPPAMIEVDNIVPSNMRAKAAEYIKEQEMIELETKVAELNENVKHSNSHVETIRNALTPIARSFIPEGYTETSLDNITVSHRRPCSASIEQAVVERYIGGFYIIDVVELKNTNSRPYLIQEHQCMAEDVIAIGTLEKMLLRPNEMTEMYILRDKFFKQDKQLRRRVRGQ